MDKRISLKKFEIFSTIFTIVVGTLLHFTFNWSNNNSFVGIFSAVNESTWEHLKILFFPMLITTIVGYFYYKDIPNYLCNKTKGILLSLLFIVVFFYTYSGILGTNYAIINILSFIFAIIIGEVYFYRQIKLNTSCNLLLSIIILLGLTLSFFIFTFIPPQIGLFIDPVNQTYGIDNSD